MGIIDYGDGRVSIPRLKSGALQQRKIMETNATYKNVKSGIIEAKVWIK